MPEEDNSQINHGYPLAQLLKALSGAGDQAEKRIRQWQQVLAGLFDGTLHIGSRTPVANVPAWVTLEIVHGGFATGSLAASGPLSEAEREKLKQLTAASENQTTPSVGQKVDRRALNLHYLDDTGRSELTELLTNGCFRVHLPEEAALLVATWLVNSGELERAADLVDTIMPFFEKLRFYPIFDTRPIRTGSGVYVQTAGDSVKSLRKRGPKFSVQKMNETLEFWNPLYDRAVSLFIDTVDGELPHFKITSTNQLERSADGQPIVAGGWPCQQYPEDWEIRARNLLQEYDDLCRQHSLCKKPKNPKGNLSRLRTYLITATQTPRSLTGRDVGMIRKILASYNYKNGAPNSERLQGLRAAQKTVVARPLHAALAGVLADRLQGLPADEGVPDVEKYFEPLSADEALKINGSEGAKLPKSATDKAIRCLEAPLDALLHRQLVPSSEIMATMLPLLTARIRCASIDDKNLARIFATTYRAFSLRRSSLLLNLESQVRFEELPWISALEPWVGSDEASRQAAREALVQATTLAIRYYPYTILPNKLTKELRSLAAAAGIKMPLVDELAADIFMGEFTSKFLGAAKIAAEILQGTLYERYYGLDYTAVLNLNDVKKVSTKASTSLGFARMCEQLADTTSDTTANLVVRNGKIIEQSQILTTHNLAVLYSAADLADLLRPKLQDLASHCLMWICFQLQLRKDSWQAKLQTVKNCAYAWRQMIFYLALMDQDDLKKFLDSSRESLSTKPEPFRERFAPAMEGLAAIAQGGRFDSDGTHSSGGCRFLGWTAGKHWLLVE